MSKYLKLIFYSLLVMACVVSAQLFIPAISELIEGGVLFLLPIIIFSLLGAGLLFLARKEKIGKRLKKNLTITGASAAGFFLFILLHNLFYALEMLTTNLGPINYLMRGLHTLSFLIAMLACPLGFFLGVLGSLFLLIKNKK